MQVVENKYELLLVSQFTLFGNLKGNKLEFVKAMPPQEVNERAGPPLQ